MVPEIIHLKTVDSTNSYLLENIENMQDRQVVVANMQTSGRGRFNRPWISEDSGNVYLSVLLKPQVDQHILGNVSQFMALVVTDVFLKYCIETQLKWPNDVMVNGKKIAGILSESRYIGNKLQGFVLGLGVNLNMTEDNIKKIDQPATALNIISGHTIGRDIFINEVLIEFFAGYDLLLKKGFSVIKDAYCNRCGFIGNSINVNVYGEIKTGIVKSITENGELVLHSEDKEFIIHSGEIIT
ncbi:MAG: biotin--[acetyl-CoA-carboxylase] ligase [Candidatus Margulisbacteria bacterium GWF2_35_9]|nr:MAG: biotin--[acetyl-CoA-carboxylase] ligase [Candidatus Margulisbacteria bacterium GWF2_35_9]